MEITSKSQMHPTKYEEDSKVAWGTTFESSSYFTVRLDYPNDRHIRVVFYFSWLKSYFVSRHSLQKIAILFKLNINQDIFN